MATLTPFGLTAKDLAEIKKARHAFWVGRQPTINDMAMQLAMDPTLGHAVFDSPEGRRDRRRLERQLEYADSPMNLTGFFSPDAALIKRYPEIVANYKAREKRRF